MNASLLRRVAVTVVACVAIVAGGAWTVQTIFATEPEAERTDSVRQYPMLVEVLEVEVGTYRPVLRALGTVEPVREVSVSPRVSGFVESMHDDLLPGGVVTAGTTLAELDDADFYRAVHEHRAAVERAEAAVELEADRRSVASADLDALGDTIGDSNRDLILRDPQRRIADADVDAAQAALRQAQLDLGRTTIEAPFDALVLERTAEVGEQVGPGTTLARLVAVDTWWVIVTVPEASLRWLTFADDPSAGAPVRITSDTAWPDGTARTGRLVRRLGAIERDTRMARVVVAVDDPLARDPANADAPPLLIGSFVQAELPARTLANVARIPRDLVRGGDTVWVMVDDALEIRDVEVAYRDDTYAYVRSGLADGDQLVTTHLRTIRDGAPLRTEGGTDSDSTAPGEAGE